jgi:hypothetical protein
MSDEDALKLLRETLENAKKTTESHPNAFFRIFSVFTESLMRMSEHIHDDNLRVCALYLRLLGAPLRGYFDYILQNQVIKKLKASLKEEEDIRGEIILNAASRSLSVRVLSEDDGRDVVDIGRLREDFSSELEGLDEPTKVLVILKVSNAIREIYDSTPFVEESKKEMLRFYDELIKSSEKGWMEVYDALREYTREWDKEAIMWKRVVV